MIVPPSGVRVWLSTGVTDMRREKTDISYSAIISFACGQMLVKSVHTASHVSPAQ